MVIIKNYPIMYLFGASGHGKVIKDILNANGIKVEAFVDDNPNVNECGGRPVLHDAMGLSPMILSIGVNRIRKMIVERLRANNSAIEFATAIHPSAVISPSAKIGEGTVVMAGAVINADAVIGNHCIVNTGATVDHDCMVEDYCHVAPGVHISGGLIGAGRVEVKDIPEYVTAFGCPAKVKSNFKEDNISRTKEEINSGGVI